MADPKKPGYKTTEGWFTAIVTLLSMLYALGILGDGQSAPDHIAALITAALATAGYTVSRGKVKAANAAADASSSAEP